jgi:CubicO group peptidase (beta-lactamase class C family)
MRHTVADHADSLIQYRARFYRRADGRLLNARFTDDSYKWASGGFLSTAEDLVRFGMGLVDHRILKPESVKLMFTTQQTRGGDETGYGMGWRPRNDWQGHRVIHHGGSSEGGRAFLLIYPETGLVIALLANLNPAPVFEQEAQTIAHFFLEHPRDTLVRAAPAALRGTYGFTALLRKDSIAGSVELTGSSRQAGSMRYGTGAPIPLLVVDTLHSDRVRIVGAGSQGLVNLWISFTPEGFHGTWDWLGATVDIRGSRQRR